jgi:hypothetical protein
MQFNTWLEENESKITLDSRVDALWGPSKSFGMYANELLAQLEAWSFSLRDIIKITYEQMKKAMWQATAESFGYEGQAILYTPLPPQGWEKMSDQEKRVAIFSHSLGRLNNAIFDLYRCKNRTRHDSILPHPTILPPLPEAVVKWLDYLKEEMEHDEDMLNYRRVQEEALRKQDEKWAMRAKKQEDDAQLLAKALFKAKNKLPYWSDITPEESLKIARDYMKATPYERGEFSRAIHDIARTTLSKRLPAKSYYMQAEEVKVFLQKTSHINLEAIQDNELINIFNKAVGITDSQDLMGTGWGENVVPALSAGDLGLVGGLRIQSANEIRNRLQNADDAKIHKIYYALDEENRKLFFKSH